MDSSKVAFSVMFTGNAKGDVLQGDMFFTNLCIFMTSGLKEVLLVPDTIYPKLVGLTKPHSQTGFSK